MSRYIGVFFAVVILQACSFFNDSSSDVSEKNLPVRKQSATCEFDAKSMASLEACVEKGDASAQYTLGVKYLNGDGIQEDTDRGLKLITLAAEQDYAEAHLTLGVAYAKGIGMSVNSELAFKWTESAAQLGNSDAMVNLGNYYLHGFGRQADIDKSFQLYLQAAELNNNAAKVNLSKSYFLGRGTERNINKAIEWAKRSAENDYVVGIGHLGAIYTLTQNYKDGFFWTNKAAQLGHPGAQANLAAYYLNGWGVEQNTELAMTWLNAAVSQQDAHGLYLMGVLYAEGKVLPRDDAKAYVFYKQAADLGEPYAQHNLAGWLWEGRHVAKNEAEALRLYTQAASQGVRDSMVSLSKIYENGFGTIPMDKEKSNYWRQQAAKYGN